MSTRPAHHVEYRPGLYHDGRMMDQARVYAPKASSPLTTLWLAQGNSADAATALTSAGWDLITPWEPFGTSVRSVSLKASALPRHAEVSRDPQSPQEPLTAP